MSVAHCTRTDVCTERYCTRTRTWAAGMIIAQQYETTSTVQQSTVRVRPGGEVRFRGRGTFLLPNLVSSTRQGERYCTVLIELQSVANLYSSRYRPAGGITSGTKYSYSYDLGTTQKRATRGILYSYSYEYSTVYADRRSVQLFQGLMNSRAYCTFIQAKRGMGALPASRVSMLMLRNVRGA